MASGGGCYRALPGGWRLGSQLCVTWAPSLTLRLHVLSWALGLLFFFLFMY